MSFDIAFDYVRILSLILQGGHPQKLAFKTPFIRFWQIRISTALPLPEDSHAEHALCWQKEFIVCKETRKKLRNTKLFLSTYLQ